MLEKTKMDAGETENLTADKTSWTMKEEEAIERQSELPEQQIK